MAGTGYRAQTKEMPFDTDQPLFRDNLERTDKYLDKMLDVFGVNAERELRDGPAAGSVPRVFLFEDGKLVTPKEKGMTLRDLVFASAMGKVFVYPDGERYPVQLHGEMREDGFHLVKGSPLSRSTDGKVAVEAPPEPAAKPQPKWYHRLFKFWGRNRSICEEYDAYTQKRAAWKQQAEKDAAEADGLAKLVDEAYTPQRTEQALNAEVRRSELLSELDTVNHHLALHARPAQIMENVYAREPKPRQDWIKSDGSTEGTGLYAEGEFGKLKAADIDLNGKKIGEKSVTEREFAALFMFGTFTHDIAVKTQTSTVTDAEQLLRDFEAQGFTAEDGREILLGSIFSGASVDLLGGDNRMSKYFECTVNPGRENAAEALRTYPGDKAKLAEILSRAVQHTGTIIGTQWSVSSSSGVCGMSQACGEMIDLMKRDPELEKLAKEAYEKRERDFCEKHPLLGVKFRSWDSHIRNIGSYNKLVEAERKGLEAKKTLLEAELNGVKLTPEQRKACVKDALKANIVTEQYRQQSKLTTDDDKISEHNGDRMKLNEYVRQIKKDAPSGAKLATTGKGSSLPADAPSVLLYSVRGRVTQKTQAMRAMGDEKQIDALDKEIERMMEKEGVAEKTLGELNTALGEYGDYTGADLMEKLAENNAPQPAPQKTVGAPAKDFTLENQPVKENAVSNLTS